LAFVVFEIAQFHWNLPNNHVELGVVWNFNVYRMLVSSSYPCPAFNRKQYWGVRLGKQCVKRPAQCGR